MKDRMRQDLKLLLDNIEGEQSLCDQLWASSDNPSERHRLSMAHVSLIQAAYQIRECLIWRDKE